MKLNMSNSAQVYSAVVVAALLILTAWGNAIAMLIFSAIAAAAWIVVPDIRGQIPIRRGLLTGAVGVAVAAVVACLMVLSRNP